MKSIRVVMTVTSASPELYAELEKLPARLRAERVRTLATIGLAALSGTMPKTVRHDPGGVDKDKPDRAFNYAKSLIDGI